MDVAPGLIEGLQRLADEFGPAGLAAVTHAMRCTPDGRLYLPDEAEQQYPRSAVEHIMQFFAYAHLPEKSQLVSRPFCELAEWVVDNLPRNPERTTALRKVLEAKDCAVRAFIAVDPTPT